MIAIATEPGGDGYLGFTQRFASTAKGWDQALCTHWVSAWIRASGSGAMDYRPWRHGLLIGVDHPVETGRSPPEPATLQALLAERWGAYLALEVDEPRRQIRLMRDPSGRLECWRLQLSGVDIFFSHWDDVAAAACTRFTLNWDYIHYHLHNDWDQGAETACKEIEEVIRGQAVFYENGQSRTELLWRPDQIAEDSYATLEEARFGIRKAAELVVRGWASRYQRIGVNLSGGLDSAIVLGLLTKAANHPDIICINHGIEDAEGDEVRYARDAARFNNVKLDEVTITIEDARSTPSFSRRLFRPTMRMMSLGYDRVGTDFVTRHDRQALFTGSGGDHVFFDNLGVLAACDYRRRHRRLADLPGLLRTVHGLAQVSRDTVWRAALLVVLDQVGVGSRRNSIGGAYDARYLTEVGRRLPDHRRFEHPWSRLARESAPPAKRGQMESFVDLQRHYYRYGFADAADETHPFMAQPMLEAGLRTPAYWFAANDRQRGLARTTFADVIPASIRDRRTKSYNSSHWRAVVAQKLPEFRSVLLDGYLVERGLVDRNVIDRELTASGLSGDGAFGMLITCLTTELWIRQAERDHDLVP